MAHGVPVAGAPRGPRPLTASRRLDDPRLELPPFDAPRLLTVLTHLIQIALVRDWPAALKAYEQARGVELDGVVEIELDDLGRVTNLRSRLG